MSKARQNMQAGMRALLGGNSSPTLEPTSSPQQGAPEPADVAESEPDTLVEPQDVRPTMSLVPSEETTHTEAQVNQPPVRKGRGPSVKTTAEHQKAGTIEQPVLRARDNRHTRKIGVVLPIDLISRIKQYCSSPEQAVNRFIENALEAELKRLTKKSHT